MSNPQQPELRRSGRTPVDQSSAKAVADPHASDAGPVGNIPEENQPGHHPEVEQDKPTAPPAARKRKTKAAKQSEPAKSGGATNQVKGDRPAQRFPFRFERKLVPFSLGVGVMPRTAEVEVDDGELRVRFGLWSLRTSRRNIESAEVTGPFAWYRVAGPPHVSLRDRGVTFATTTERGVCIKFREPVTAVDPVGIVRHPAATVTVEDPEALVAALTNG